MTQKPAPRRSREQLQLLAVREILRATAAALPLDEILSVVCNVAIIVSDATTAWFVLAEGASWRAAVARGEFAAALAGATCLAADCSCLSRCRESAILQPAEVDPADPVIGPLAGSQLAVALLPLRYGGDLLGFLGCAVIAESPPDLSFLTIIAEQAAAAIVACRLREDTRAWRERLDAVFDRMAEAVLVYDGDGRLALMNAAAEELLGDRGVGPGDCIADVVRKSGLLDASGRPFSVSEAPAGDAMRGGRVDNLEVTIPPAGGPARHLLVSAVPLASAGYPFGAVLVARDITYIRELEKMRAEFLSMVSHELRSPLTSVLGFAQLMQRRLPKGQAPADVVRWLDLVVEQAKKVNALVEDLLDVSRAEAGRLALTLQQVDLAALIRQVVRVTSALAPGHRTSADIPAPVPLVPADPARIEQVLRNLLSNALKFSQPGTEIVVRLVAEGGMAVVSVSDQGPGIAKADLPALFMPFHRVRQARGRDVKGLGLGLFISRSIVQAHGGEMWVQSQLGAGSTFHFSLPLAQQRAGSQVELTS